MYQHLDFHKGGFLIETEGERRADSKGCRAAFGSSDYDVCGGIAACVFNANQFCSGGNRSDCGLDRDCARRMCCRSVLGRKRKARDCIRCYFFADLVSLELAVRSGFFFYVKYGARNRVVHFVQLACFVHFP